MPIENINITAAIGRIRELISQTGHGFVVGNVVRCDNTTPNIYVKALADTEDNAKAVGVVTAVTDANNFELTLGGRMTSGVPAQAQGTVMYLSDSVAGAMVTTAPTIAVRIMEISQNAASGIVNIDWKGGAGGGSVASVTGDSVDNTDPANPVVNAWPLAGTGSDLANGTIGVDPAFNGNLILQDDGAGNKRMVQFLPTSFRLRAENSSGDFNYLFTSAQSCGISVNGIGFNGEISASKNGLSDAATYPVLYIIDGIRIQTNAIATPTVNDDSTIGYDVNSFWIYDGKLWICTDATSSAAVWVQVSGTSLSLETDGTPNGDQTLLNLAAGTGITLTDNGTGTVTIDNSLPAAPAIVPITRAALQALLTGSTADTTVTYRITDALTSTAQIDVWADTASTLQSAAIDQTNTYFGFYNIVGDTFTQVYKANFSVLPMAEGGTNKNMTASAGAVVFSDTDSLELTAVGTSGQVLKSAGTGTPTWGEEWKEVIISGNATTASNVVSDVSGTSISVAANSTYYILATFRTGCDNTGGTNWGFNLPAGATGGYRLIGNTTAANAISQFGASQTADFVTATALNAENSVGRAVRWEIKLVTAGTAGTFVFRWKSVVNTQTSTVFADGSQIMYKKVA